MYPRNTTIIATPTPPSAAGPRPPTSFVSTSPMAVAPARTAALGAASDTSVRIVHPNALATSRFTQNCRNISLSNLPEPVTRDTGRLQGSRRRTSSRRLWLRRLVARRRARSRDRVERDARTHDVEESHDRLHRVEGGSKERARQPRLAHPPE